MTDIKQQDEPETIAVWGLFFMVLVLPVMLLIYHIYFLVSEVFG